MTQLEFFVDGMGIDGLDDPRPRIFWQQMYSKCEEAGGYFSCGWSRNKGQSDEQ